MPQDKRRAGLFVGAGPGADRSAGQGRTPSGPARRRASRPQAASGGTRYHGSHLTSVERPPPERAERAKAGRRATKVRTRHLTPLGHSVV